MSSFQEWESGIVNRNFHILKHLLQSQDVRRVVAVDYLPFSLRRGFKSFLENQAFGAKGKVIYRDLTNRLVRVDYSSLGKHVDKLFVYSTIDSTVSESLTLRAFKRILRKLRIERPILWSYVPLFTWPFTKLDTSLKIFDAVDDWRNHSAYEDKRDKLEESYKVIKKEADLIFTVADDLRLLFDNQPKVYWIPNGVDFDRWQGQFEFEEDLKGITPPIIGYAGVIQNRIDLKLIKHVAESNPNKSFVFVGMVWPEVNKGEFAANANVHFLGQKPYNDLPKYMTHFHVGIIPHKVDPFTKSMNPLKLYEYLACGLPVVSTPIAGMEMFPEFVKVASDYDYFSQQIDTALTEDSEIHRIKRREAVKPHSWETRMDKMMKLIKGNG
ncbi:glycosyltransferase [Patescibacteria group bacterium]|nr:glycosyltransferase [Patescibacteria group bacterium]MBU1890873.1 glycosyltransferase [Patescibacteria group bacterium]